MCMYVCVYVYVCVCVCSYFFPFLQNSILFIFRFLSAGKSGPLDESLVALAFVLAVQQQLLASVNGSLVENKLRCVPAVHDLSGSSSSHEHTTAAASSRLHEYSKIIGVAPSG